MGRATREETAPRGPRPLFGGLALCDIELAQ